jgi:hypothetical protein
MTHLFAFAAGVLVGHLARRRRRSPDLSDMLPALDRIATKLRRATTAARKAFADAHAASSNGCS